MHFSFLKGLDRDIQASLLNQLRDLWTHTSTAIEGNSLSLGDTKFIIEEGLTVSGKPIKDHQEVLGHAKALELIYSMLGRAITEQDLFALHQAVQSERVFDIYKPYGAWKLEPNGTNMVDEHGQQVFVEYASPQATPKLMAEVIDYINESLNENGDGQLEQDRACAIYAKIHLGIAHIHPFWDGNGRIARLVSNLPLLNSGLLPIIIPNDKRRDYLDTLFRCQRDIGQLSTSTGVWPNEAALSKFIEFCRSCYGATQALHDNALKQQALRAQ